MAPTDQEPKIVPPAEEPEEMPLPSDPKAIFLGGLFVLALLATAYVASEIVLPLVFAIILKLLLQPAMRILEQLRIPRIPAALLLIVALFGTIVGLGTAISGPAASGRLSDYVLPHFFQFLQLRFYLSKGIGVSRNLGSSPLQTCNFAV
jgi:predicted PurR-regulated permease PerM